MERSRVALTERSRGRESEAIWTAIRATKIAASHGVKSLCDSASDHAPVMLHLRARYVSKAAILTIPATIFAGRKSKSRLNSKGLDR
jgi:hypothetical protein